MPTSEDQIISEYLPLVRRNAMQMASRVPANIPIDDLIQAGLMGLLDAVRRYERVYDAQFETYATTRIRGAIVDELRSQDWLPRSVRHKARKIEKAIVVLTKRLMRSPTEMEIADELGVPLAEYQQLLIDAQGTQVVHYEDFGKSEHDSELGNPMDYLTDGEWLTSGDNPLSILISDSLRDALSDAIRNLPGREQLLLALQFEQDLNQKEIALIMGLSEGRVSQLRSQAIVRIRATMTETGWHERPAEVFS